MEQPTQDNPIALRPAWRSMWRGLLLAVFFATAGVHLLWSQHANEPGFYAVLGQWIGHITNHLLIHAPETVEVIAATIGTGFSGVVQTAIAHATSQSSDVNRILAHVHNAAPFINLLIAALIWLRILIRRYFSLYLVYPDRVREHVGIIARKQFGVSLDKINAINLRQGFLPRLIGYGHLDIFSAGTHRAEVTFKGIAHPEAYRDHINALTRT